MNRQGQPLIDAEAPNSGYLAEALGRAGKPLAIPGTVEEERLDGGRTGVKVSRLHCGGGTCFVLKTIPRKRAFADALGHDGEAAAWLAGAMNDLPPPLKTPIIDAALHHERDEWWLLMEDVSSGIVSRAGWREDHTRQLFEAMAPLHAKHWNRDGVAQQGVGALSDTTALLVEIAVSVATGAERTNWVARAADEFQVPGMLLPEFLTEIGTENADFYKALLHRWPDVVAELEKWPQTFLHGDLRRANLAFKDDHLFLFDWELAATGPAAVDLTWHWFLHYWAYPPDDSCHPDDRLWLRDIYLQRLEEALGRPIDRAGFLTTWELGWLRAFSQLGFVLVDGLGRETAEFRKDIIDSAFVHARRIVDEHPL